MNTKYFLIISIICFINNLQSVAQNAFYVHKNNGVVNQYLIGDVNSIEIKQSEGSENYVQEINTVDSISRIPVELIDSVSFSTLSTCADVIAGPDGQRYRVSGVCTGISNTNYGNFYLNDGTGEIYIYGTVNNNGIYDWASFGIETGDEVTVEGPKSSYYNIVELVDATFICVNKSLLKIESIDLENNLLPVEGGDFTVSLACRTSNSVSVEISEEAQWWLEVMDINDGSAPTVKFHAAPNVGGNRDATIVFKVTDGKRTCSLELTITQQGSIIEVSIADFMAAEPGSTLYRISGIITQVANTTYGNCYIKDYSGETYVYGIGSRGDFEKLGLKIGDIVTLVGNRGEYKGEVEMIGAYVENFNSVTEVSIGEFLSKEDDTNVYYRVTGTVTEIVNETYGNLYISDGINSLYIYGCYSGWGATGDARKGCISEKGIEIGDKLTVIGSKTTYNGTPEVNSGIYFSHEKAE